METTAGAPASIRTQVRVPLRFPDGYAALADVTTFHGLADGLEHVALAFGSPTDGAMPLVRVHSECLTGDVFGSARCDCGPQLREAVEQIEAHGGVLLYLRQEGRGIGLYNKLDAYRLQIEEGLDTYEANRKLHFPDDLRDYAVAADMLRALGISRIRLLTNNPEKVSGLGSHGIIITDVMPTGIYQTGDNEGYLRTKQNRAKAG